MALTLTAVQRCLVSVSAVDAKGNPAEVQDPTYSVSDDTILRVDKPASLEGKPGQGYVVAVGPVGHAQLVVKGDADLGEGVKEIQGILEVEVVAAEAVAVQITPGEPEPNPEINPLPGAEKGTVGKGSKRPSNV